MQVQLGWDIRMQFLEKEIKENTLIIKKWHYITRKQDNAKDDRK